MNGKERHDKAIEEVCKVFIDKGFKVVRLDKRHYPDVVFIKNGEICAIEIETQNSWTCAQSKKKSLEESEFQEIYIFQTPIAKHKKFKIYLDAYNLCLMLREKGYSYSKIRKEIEKKLKIKVARSAISSWVTGKYKPYGLRRAKIIDMRKKKAK